ncbi:MAG: hypothetical protein J6J24_01470 [Clostridia bacterium]|nr:hypothetical protein [Clostridia bacterium]
MSVVFCLVAIFTGIFVAIKSNNNCTLSQLKEICLGDFYSGISASSSAFMPRLVSLCVNIVLLSLLAFSKFLFPLAQVLFVYRGYLLGVNFALIFIFYGIGSMVTAIVVVLPCQLAILMFLIIYYLIFLKINTNCKRFGHCECNRLLYFCLGFAGLLLVNLVETLLLILLNGTVIMVI